MKIERLDLLAYGPFTQHTLDFGQEESGLHVIFGNNEAGKSTSLRALTALLFGFPTRVSDVQLHDYKQLRVGGALSLRSGVRLEFVRRKGNKDTLLCPTTDASLPEDALQPFLQGLDEGLFTRAYGINHDRLIEGGRDILRQSGDLGQALFSAALGSASFRALAERLDNEAAEIFLPRSPKRLLNLALTEFKGAHKAINDAKLSVNDYKNLQKEIKKTHNEILRIEEELQLHGHHQSMLKRVQRILGAAAERRELISAIDADGSVQLLPLSFTDLQTARETRRSAEEAHARTTLKRERRQLDLKALAVRTDFIEHRETIEAIQRELGAAEKALADRPAQDSKRRLLRNEAIETLKRIRPDLTLDTAEPLRLTLNNRRWIDDLARQHDLLKQRIAKLASEQAQHAQARASLAPGDDTAPNTTLDVLRAATLDARRAGDLEARRDEAARTVNDLRARAEEEFTRLGRFTGTRDALLATPFPVSETLNRFQRLFEDADQQDRERQRNLSELRREHQKLNIDLRTLLDERPVPSLGELEAARVERDAAWALLRDQPSAPPDLHLILRIERSITRADQLADLLRTSAADVQRRAQLEAQLTQLEARIAALQDEAHAAVVALAAHRDAWTDAWTASAITPDSPREMTQWLDRVDALRTRVDTLTAAEANRARLQASIDAHTRALTIGLEELHVEILKTRLTELLELAEHHLDVHARRGEGRRLALEKLRDLDATQRRLQDEADAIDAERDRWREEWTQALTHLHLGADDPPIKALAVMEALAGFFSQLDQSEELRRRLYGIDLVQTRFEERVREFVALVGFPDHGHSITEIAQRLVTERDAALIAQSQHDALTKELRELDEEAAEATLNIQAAEARLAAMRERAEVATDKDLELAIQRSNTQLTLRDRLGLVERELIRSGDGHPVADLLKEVDRVEADTLEDELQRVADRLLNLQSERDQLRYQHKTLEERLRSLDGSAHAAAASEEAQQQLATIVTSSRDYLRLKLASAILAAQVERYRQHNQAPVLRRASDLFQRLTLGSFAGLRDELDDTSRPVLLGLRPGDLEVHVEGMSDGTRDQLFLALRLATLEQHLDRGEPMPFVVDDILVTFDDLRTRACLDVLAELATRTQVLVFTHHKRVIEIARDMPAHAAVRTHSLTPPPTPASSS